MSCDDVLGIMYAKVSVRKECYIECGSGKFSARPAAVSSAKFQWQWFQSGASASAAVLEHTNSVAPRVKPSNSTSTPRRRDGFLFFRTFILVVTGSGRMYYLLQLGGVVVYFSVSVDPHSVFSPCFLLYVHSLLRYFFTCVPVGLGSYSLANIP